MTLFPRASPESVLRRCMRLEASPVCKVSTVIAELRQDTGRTPTPDAQRGMTPLDWQAQATMILARTERELSRREWLALRAWYTVPEGAVLRRKREEAIVRLSRLLASELAARGDRHGKSKRVRYIVRAWVRLSGRLPRDEAANIGQRLGMDPRHVYRVLLAYGSRPGWWRILNRWRDVGLMNLESVYFDAGWVEHSAEVERGR